MGQLGYSCFDYNHPIPSKTRTTSEFSWSNQFVPVYFRHFTSVEIEGKKKIDLIVILFGKIGKR